MKIRDLTDSKDKRIEIVFKLTDERWEASNMYFDGGSEDLVLTRICSYYNYQDRHYDLVLREKPGFDKVLCLCHWNGGEV